MGNIILTIYPQDFSKITDYVKDHLINALDYVALKQFGSKDYIFNDYDSTFNSNSGTSVGEIIKNYRIP